MMVMRSADWCAGVPFNIASTALLTSLIAKLLYVQAHKIIIMTGDTHVYEEHLEGARTQIERTPLTKPQLLILREAPPKEASIEEKVKWLETLQYEDVAIENYTCLPAIKYKMIA
jgi:thymidylate synthase